MIDLHQLHRRSVHFNHGNQHPSTRTARRNHYLLVADCLRQVVDLEGNVRNGLHQVWIRRVVPVSLPLNAEWVVLVITYRHLQVRQWNLASEICGRRYPYVVVLHYSTLAHTVDGPRRFSLHKATSAVEDTREVSFFSGVLSSTSPHTSC